MSNWQKSISDKMKSVRPVITFIFDTSGSMSPNIYKAFCKIMDEGTLYADVYLIQWTTKLEYFGLWSAQGLRPQLKGYTGTQLDGAVKFCYENPELKNSSQIFVVSDCYDMSLRNLKGDSRITFVVISDEEWAIPKQFSRILIPKL